MGPNESSADPSVVNLIGVEAEDTNSDDDTSSSS